MSNLNLKKDVLGCKHPNSRKTLALAKKNKKEKRKNDNKIGQLVKQNLIGEKILWFKENLSEESSHDVDRNELAHRLIERYLTRFDEELEQIALKNSIGGRRNRQHASREDIIRMTKQREAEEYRTCGIEIPNLTDSVQFDLLKSWNGELRFIQNFKLKRFIKKI